MQEEIIKLVEELRKIIGPQNYNIVYEVGDMDYRMEVENNNITFSVFLSNAFRQNYSKIPAKEFFKYADLEDLKLKINFKIRDELEIAKNRIKKLKAFLKKVESNG